MKKYERPAMRMVEMKQTQMILSGSLNPQGGDGGDNPSRSFSMDGDE